MGNDFKKQTSTISANHALEFLRAHGFQIATLREIKPLDDIPKAYRKDVLAARRQYGESAAISNTGRSLMLIGLHAATHREALVDVPLFGMLGHGALEAIQQKTGLTITN